MSQPNEQPLPQLAAPPQAGVPNRTAPPSTSQPGKPASATASEAIRGPPLPIAPDLSSQGAPPPSTEPQYPPHHETSEHPGSRGRGYPPSRGHTNGYERRIGRGTSWRRDHGNMDHDDYTYRGGRGRGSFRGRRSSGSFHRDGDYRPPPRDYDRRPPPPSPYPPPGADPYYEARGPYPSPGYDSRREYPPVPVASPGGRGYYDEYARPGFDPRDLSRGPPPPVPPEERRFYDRGPPPTSRDDDYAYYSRPRGDPRDDYRGPPDQRYPRDDPRYIPGPPPNRSDPRYLDEAGRDLRRDDPKYRELPPPEKAALPPAPPTPIKDLPEPGAPSPVGKETLKNGHPPRPADPRREVPYRYDEYSRPPPYPEERGGPPTREPYSRSRDPYYTSNYPPDYRNREPYPPRELPTEYARGPPSATFDERYPKGPPPSEVELRRDVFKSLPPRESEYGQKRKYDSSDYVAPYYGNDYEARDPPYAERPEFRRPSYDYDDRNAKRFRGPPDEPPYGGRPYDERGPPPRPFERPDYRPPARPKGRYFLVKTPTHETLEKSRQTGHWGIQVKDVEIFREAYKAGPVTLIFALDETGRFAGYAEMSSEVGSVPPAAWMEEHCSPVGAAFEVKHRTTDDVRTNATVKGRNFMTEGQPIRFGPDGQEISAREAATLVEELENMSGPQNAERRANAVVTRGRGRGRGRGGPPFERGAPFERGRGRGRD